MTFSKSVFLKFTIPLFMLGFLMGYQNCGPVKFQQSSTKANNKDGDCPVVAEGGQCQPRYSCKDFYIERREDIELPCGSTSASITFTGHLGEAMPPLLWKLVPDQVSKFGEVVTFDITEGEHEMHIWSGDNGCGDTFHIHAHQVCGPGPSPTNSPTATPSISPSSSASPTPTISPTATPSASPSATPSSPPPTCQQQGKHDCEACPKVGDGPCYYACVNTTDECCALPPQGGSVFNRTYDGQPLACPTPPQQCPPAPPPPTPGPNCQNPTPVLDANKCIVGWTPGLCITPTPTPTPSPPACVPTATQIAAALSNTSYWGQPTTFTVSNLADLKDGKVYVDFDDGSPVQSFTSSPISHTFVSGAKTSFNVKFTALDKNCDKTLEKVIVVTPVVNTCGVGFGVSYKVTEKDGTIVNNPPIVHTDASTQFSINSIVGVSSFEWNLCNGASGTGTSVPAQDFNTPKHCVNHFIGYGVKLDGTACSKLVTVEFDVDHNYKTVQLPIGSETVKPAVKMFFIVDNSETMENEQTKLRAAFANMFATAGSSLLDTNVSIYVMNTAQTHTPATENEFVKIPKASISQIANGSNLSNLTATGSCGTVPYRCWRATFNQSPDRYIGKIPGDFVGFRNSGTDFAATFEVAPVTRFFAPNGDVNATPMLTSTNYHVTNVQPGDVTPMSNDFNSRILLLDPKRYGYDGGSYFLLTKNESGHCAMARVLSESAKYLNPGDQPAFIVVSDENDDFITGEKCIAAQGNVKEFKGACVTKGTRFEYASGNPTMKVDYSYEYCSTKVTNDRGQCPDSGISTRWGSFDAIKCGADYVCTQTECNSYGDPNNKRFAGTNVDCQAPANSDKYWLFVPAPSLSCSSKCPTGMSSTCGTSTILNWITNNANPKGINCKVIGAYDVVQSEVNWTPNPTCPAGQTFDQWDWRYVQNSVSRVAGGLDLRSYILSRSNVLKAQGIQTPTFTAFVYKQSDSIPSGDAGASKDVEYKLTVQALMGNAALPSHYHSLKDTSYAPALTQVSGFLNDVLIRTYELSLDPVGLVIDEVKLNGVTLTPGTQYTIQPPGNIIRFADSLTLNVGDPVAVKYHYQ